jgi:hypothetical protein
MSIYNLKIFKKSKLSFAIPETNSNDRDIRGNRKANTVFKEITVQLYPERNPMQRDSEAHTDDEVYYTGYIVEPKRVPEALRSGAVGKGTVNGISYSRVELQAIAQYDLTLVDKIFQEPIRVKCSNHIKWGTSVPQDN